MKATTRVAKEQQTTSRDKRKVRKRLVGQGTEARLRVPCSPYVIDNEPFSNPFAQIMGVEIIKGDRFWTTEMKMLQRIFLS